MTANIADQRTRETRTVHVDHAVTVTTRMPTAAERERGYPDAPVLVVTRCGRDLVYPAWVELTFDDPHGQPEPDQVHDAAAYVLATVSEELANIRGRVKELGDALGGPRCRVTELADEVREQRDEEMYCAAASLCRLRGTRG